MKGEPIEAVKVGLASLISSLRQDAHALETVHLCLMTFDREVKKLVPLTSLDEFVLPEIMATEASPTFTGLALKEVCSTVEREVIKSTTDQKGDWRPLLFVMTDGGASDIQLFNEMILRVKQTGFGAVVGCAAGPKAKPEELKKVCGQVVALDTMDGHSFQAFFKWVSASISTGSQKVDSEQKEVVGLDDLPPPPPEVNVVV